tara:strand:+ start:618 stop:908 length:291 start_codon:yes stop_codon:yes gene_type:complete
MADEQVTAPKAPLSLQQQVETGFVRTLSETSKDLLGNVSTTSKLLGHGLRAGRKKAANFEFFSGIEDDVARHEYIEKLPPELQEQARDNWKEIISA